MPQVPDCPARISFQPLTLTDGDHIGTAAGAGGLRLAEPATGRRYADPYIRDAVARRYVQGRWRSPVVEPGFAFTELVPTWHARTPERSWVEIAARVRTKARWSRWLVLARWADHDTELRPTSVPDQAAPAAWVATDTVRLTGVAGDAWQLQVSLLAPPAKDGPVLSYAAAMASAAGVDDAPTPAGASAGSGEPRVLEVPRLSQRVHAGHYPGWGGGGESWCSPTSVAMVLAFWGAGPERDALGWVDPGYPDREVYHAVRHCWDHGFGGAGNWSFNAAYAARFGLSAFITRLRDLAEAEAFIAAGIPLVASLEVDPARLHGSDYSSDGHLLVVTGFTEAGDVVVNDPAAVDLTTLRRVYRRAEFDAAWRAGSGRIVYVLHPPAVALPRRPAEPNW